MVTKASGLKIFVNDEIRKELVGINVTASLDSSKLVIENRYTVPKELRGALDFLYVDEQAYMMIALTNSLTSAEEASTTM